jgi:glycosyltransferase involved in cell wall biosynthesis
MMFRGGILRDDMSRENTLVSVVIPVRNGERFLGRTLASALAQTYNPIEVVIIDDGSTDRTSMLLEAAAGRDSRVRFSRTRGFGVAAARNLGVSQSRGSLIALLDADDLWHPEKIAWQVGVMEASSAEVGLVYCWSIGIDENDFIIPSSKYNSASHGRVTAGLAEGNFLHNSSSPLIRRACFDAIGGYDVNLKPHGAEDWKLYLALSDICEFAVISEYLVGYRQSSGSLSKNVKGMDESLVLVSRWLFQKWPDLSNEEVKRRLMYNINRYLAGLALDSEQWVAAIRYRLRAVRQAGYIECSSLEFGARLLARLLGLRRAVFKQSEASISFDEFALGVRNQGWQAGTQSQTKHV